MQFLSIPMITKSFSFLFLDIVVRIRLQVSVYSLVLSYYVVNIENLAEIQKLTYRDWSNEMSGSSCSVHVQC